MHIKTSILILALISLSTVETSPQARKLDDEDDNNLDMQDLSGLTGLDKELKAFDDILNKKKGLKKRMHDISDNETEEKKSWFAANKAKLINIVLFLVGLVLISIIAWKVYSLNLSLKKRNLEVKEYADQMEKLIEGSENLVFITWKDQKEGILFVENPAYKNKTKVDLTKAQQIQSDINKFEEDIKKKEAEITKLREKENYYLEEIDRLKKEYEESKKKVLDEGHALGFAETVLREFK